MPILPNPRHEAFAQARFSGMGVMEAYHAAGYVGELPQVASKVSQHPEVKARLMELHNAAGKVMAYERLDAIKDLLTIIKSKPSQASANHPLCEVRTGRQGTYHRFPSKLRAVARLMKILGWEVPVKVEVEEEPDTLKEWIAKERASPWPWEDPSPDADGAGQQETGDPSTEAQGSAAPDQQDGTTDSAAPGPPSPPCGSPSGDADEPLTPQQEAFARARFNGMGVMEAYKAAGYGGDSPERASRVSQHPKVKARIAGLRQAAEDALPYKKHEAINDLIAIMQASPEEAGPDHPLCEMRMGADGPHYRFPCKLHAMTLLERLLGWHEPEKMEIHRPGQKLDSLSLWLAQG